MSALPNPVLVSVEEYLRTTYHPDCEYVDGVIEERNLGEEAHSILQRFFIVLFDNNKKTWNTRVYPEYRNQASTTRFRVPDVTVVRADTPRGTILRTPPLIAIEILSPTDALRGLREKVGDYLRFGVEHIWILDPYSRVAYLADERGFHEPAEGSATAVLTIPGTPIMVPLADVWVELDEEASADTNN